MWGSLLVLALLTTINPVRLGLILLVLSRPRPMRNLFAYWVGALIVGLATLVGSLIALYATPASASFMKNFSNPAANPVAQGTALGIGALLLAISALMAVRSVVRRPGDGRHALRHSPDDSDPNTSTLALKSTLLSRMLYPDENESAAEGSSTRRLFGHTRNAWRSGAPWISFVIGLIFVPPLDGVLFALAIVVASGAAAGVQFVAVVAFVIGVLVIEEFILVSNWFAPTNTQAALRRVHDWAHVHQQAFVAAILAVVGASLVLRGMGGL